MLMVNFQQGALSKSGIEKKKYDFSFFKSRKTIYNEHTLPEATLPFRGFLRILTIVNKLLSEDTFSQDLHDLMDLVLSSTSITKSCQSMAQTSCCCCC